MRIDTNTIVSVTEANQNFSRVTRIAEKNGQAVIFKHILAVFRKSLRQMKTDIMISLLRAARVYS